MHIKHISFNSFADFPREKALRFPHATTFIFKKLSNIVHFSLCKAPDSSIQNEKVFFIRLLLAFLSYCLYL